MVFTQFTGLLAHSLNYAILPNTSVAISIKALQFNNNTKICVEVQTSGEIFNIVEYVWCIVY